MSHFISLQAVPLLTELASIHRSLKVEAGLYQEVREPCVKAVS